MSSLSVIEGKQWHRPLTKCTPYIWTLPHMDVRVVQRLKGLTRETLLGVRPVYHAKTAQGSAQRHLESLKERPVQAFLKTRIQELWNLTGP